MPTVVLGGDFGVRKNKFFYKTLQLVNVKSFDGSITTSKDITQSLSFANHAQQRNTNATCGFSVIENISIFRLPIDTTDKQAA